MTRKESSKPDSDCSSAATIGFEAMDSGQPNGARQTAKGSPQGERGGVHQFYTPSCVGRSLVEIPASDQGRIYDTACGSGPAAAGFVQSEKFVEFHGVNRVQLLSMKGKPMFSTL